MEPYEKPVMEIIEMETEDVILTSNPDGTSGEECILYTSNNN